MILWIVIFAVIAVVSCIVWSRVCASWYRRDQELTRPNQCHRPECSGTMRSIKTVQYKHVCGKIEPHRIMKCDCCGAIRGEPVR